MVAEETEEERKPSRNKNVGLTDIFSPKLERNWGRNSPIPNIPSSTASPCERQAPPFTQGQNKKR